MTIHRHPSRIEPWKGWWIIILFECAIAGSVVAFTLARLLAGDNGAPTPDVTAGLATVLGGIGGAVGSLILAGGYGLPGRRGWLFAVLCSLIAPPLAGGVGGTLMMPGPGTLIGAYFPLWTFYYPQSLGLWLICLVLIHLHARRLRSGHFM